MRRSAEGDRRAIMQLIESEGAAFLKKDYEAWARCWVHAPYVRRWGKIGPRGAFTWVGWADQAERIKKFMAAHPAPSTAVYRREDINLRIGRDMAWVTFDQYTTGAAGPLIDLPELNVEMRVIEREPDGWKFAFLCNYQGSFEHIRSALLRVDQDARVVWKNPQAEQELRAGCGIVLRAGRLRATDRLVDQRLQAAIRWAGEVDDGVWPRRGTLPIVLGGGGGEPTQICWVIAQDSQIFVSINDQKLIEDRLAAAAPVYGITPAQLRLASLIVAGVDLVEAAERLQVSVNTTRTHLQRMFDKTGVRSQPALVRALLSVALPLR